MTLATGSDYAKGQATGELISGVLMAAATDGVVAPEFQAEIEGAMEEVSHIASAPAMARKIQTAIESSPRLKPLVERARLATQFVYENASALRTTAQASLDPQLSALRAALPKVSNLRIGAADEINHFYASARANGSWFSLYDPTQLTKLEYRNLYSLPNRVGADGLMENSLEYYQPLRLNPGDRIRISVANSSTEFGTAGAGTQVDLVNSVDFKRRFIGNPIIWH